jgi:tetratricopeptide (TPR) repeat protein
MRLTHTNLAHSFLLLLIFGLCLPLTAAGTGASARVQEGAKRVVVSQEAASGLESFAKGDFAASVKSLRQATQKHQDDATSWHFLALSYKQLGKQKDARKAMEKAVALRLLRLAPGNFGQSVKLWDELSKEEKAERRREIAGHYREALASVESYLQLDPPAADFWRQQYEALSLHVKGEETPEAEKEIFQGNDETIVKAKVLYKPPPDYTDNSRRTQITGTVTLRGLLGADGKVKQIIALVMLPEGLTEKSIEALRKIQFKPATRDGRPVSQWATFEYNFNIY